MTATPTRRPLLIPLDGSPRAETALEYARVLNPAALVLLHVVPEPDYVLGRPLWDIAEWVTAARRDLDRIALRLDRDQPVETEVLVGDPAESIVAAAEQHRSEMIVMATRGQGALGRALFGSTSDQVARLSPVPVFLCRERPDSGADDAIRRVVVPLDGSARAEAAAPLAASVASRIGAPVHLVRAVDPGALLSASVEADSMERDSLDETAEELQSLMRERATASLERVAVGLRRQGIEADWAVVEGSPFAAIVDILTDRDLVVMTSHGRSGFTRWLLGSVAEKLLREAPAPVLLVPSPDRTAALQQPGTGD